MKITAVRTTCVALPFRQPETWSSGKRHGVNNVIVEIETDNSIVGIGEAACGSGGSPEPVRVVIDAFAAYLLGEDPRLLNRHIDRFGELARWRLWRGFTNSGLAAIESALWDILGKSVGLPVHQLLGGRVRDRVPAFGYVMHDRPDLMAEAAAALVSQGFRTLYFKVGLSAEEDERTISAIRQAVGPNVGIRVDANEAWDRAEALRRINRFAPYRLDFVEQPVKRDDIAGLADLRRRVTVPIAANQTCWTVEDVLAVIRSDAADVMVAGMHWLGGVESMVRAAAICERANVPFCRHSSGELGIATAAGLHAMSVMPLIDCGNQTYFSHWQHDIIDDESMSIRDGCQLVPDGPGLGVSLNREKLREFADRYRRDGPYVPESAA